jgi:hypothetical protein
MNFYVASYLSYCCFELQLVLATKRLMLVRTSVCFADLRVFYYWIFMCRRSRRVWHLQYSDWQEQGLPRNVSSYLQFLEELSELRRLTVRLLLENLRAVLRIRITWTRILHVTLMRMRIRILLVTLMRSRIIPFTLMRFQIRILASEYSIGSKP